MSLPTLGHLLPAATMVLVALNLRPALASIGPVLPEALAGTGLSTAWSFLLTTVPVACLGLFGLCAPAAAKRLGLERAILAFLLLLAVGLALRAYGEAFPVVLGCALGGVAIGVMNVLMPAVVKRDFPDRTAFMTGLYTMALCAGAAVAAGLTAPLEERFGGDWGLALAIWAVPALVAAAVWTLRVLGSAGGVNGPAPAAKGALWRDLVAWQVTLFMGLQSSLAYCVMAWLAPLLRARGFSPIDAGLIVSVCLMIQAPAALIAPVLAVRGRDQRPAVLVTVGLSIVGLAGCVFAPAATVWLWAVLLGVGQGAIFAVALTIIVLRAPDVALAGRLSAMSQGVGYLVASIGPLGMGLLRASTGGWTAPGLLFVALALGAGIAGWGAGRAVFVRTWERRTAPGAA